MRCCTRPQMVAAAITSTQIMGARSACRSCVLIPLSLYPEPAAACAKLRRSVRGHCSRMSAPGALATAMCAVHSNQLCNNHGTPPRGGGCYASTLLCEQCIQSSSTTVMWCFRWGSATILHGMQRISVPLQQSCTTQVGLPSDGHGMRRIQSGYATVVTHP